MATRDTSTVVMPLCFSFRLIFATTQPSRQDRSSTISEISTMSSRPPAMTAALWATWIQYTITAGRMTIAEYIRPIR